MKKEKDNYFKSHTELIETLTYTWGDTVVYIIKALLCIFKRHKDSRIKIKIYKETTKKGYKNNMIKDLQNG